MPVTKLQEESAMMPDRPANESIRYAPRPPSKFMEREWIIAFAIMGLAGLLIWKGEMDKGIELVKWTMVTFIGSRTAIKGMEVFKK